MPSSAPVSGTASPRIQRPNSSSSSASMSRSAKSTGNIINVDGGVAAAYTR